jgi:uncharacterized protein
VEINVSQLLKGAIGSVRNYDVDETVAAEGCDYAVKGIVTLMRTDHGILVKGKLVTMTGLTCSRCLNAFECPLTLEIEEVYFPKIDVTSGSPVDGPDDPGAFTIDERNILDLTDSIRQYALLAVPMKPLCRPDCAGLCPTCGVNMNQTKCDCAPQPGDPRWAVLRDLISAESKTKKGRK